MKLLSDCSWVLPSTTRCQAFRRMWVRESATTRTRARGRTNVLGCVTRSEVITTIGTAYEDDEDGVSAYLRRQHAREHTPSLLREKHGKDLVYGDVDLKLALAAVGRIIRPGEVFLDAGSGFGRVVLAVACAYPDVKSVGVEIVEELHEEAVEMREEVRRIWETDERKMGECEFFCGDFRNVCREKNIGADVVFAFCTTWRGALDGVVEGMLPVVETLKHGARVILVDGKLPSELRSKMIVEDWSSEESNAATGTSSVRAYTIRHRSEKLELNKN